MIVRFFQCEQTLGKLVRLDGSNLWLVNDPRYFAGDGCAADVHIDFVGNNFGDNAKIVLLSKLTGNLVLISIEGDRDGIFLDIILACMLLFEDEKERFVSDHIVDLKDGFLSVLAVEMVRSYDGFVLIVLVEDISCSHGDEDQQENDLNLCHS